MLISYESFSFRVFLNKLVDAHYQIQWYLNWYKNQSGNNYFSVMDVTTSNLTNFFGLDDDVVDDQKKPALVGY